MQIRVGYEISYECPQPTPMLLVLSVHPSRMPDLVGPHLITFDPPIGATVYRDGFGNLCHRIVAPAGRLTISKDIVVLDPGTPDAVVPEAAQIPVQELPDDALVYLLGSRYCDTDRLLDTAWSLFGGTPLGWARVQAICDYVHARITFGYEHADPTRTAWGGHSEQRGVCRDFAHLAITLCRCMNIPARYCTGYLGDIGVTAGRFSDGFQRLVRGVSRRPLVHVRRQAQYAAYRAHPDGARARCDGCGAGDQLRAVRACRIQGGHGRVAGCLAEGS